MYLNNEDLEKEVLWSQENGKVSERLGEMFQLIAENIGTKGSFHGYSYIEDLKANAVLGCIERYKKYDSSRPNANCFSFFTRICFQGYLRQIAKEHKHQNLMFKIRNLLHEIDLPK